MGDRMQPKHISGAIIIAIVIAVLAKDYWPLDLQFAVETLLAYAARLAAILGGGAMIIAMSLRNFRDAVGEKAPPDGSRMAAFILGVIFLALGLFLILVGLFTTSGALDLIFGLIFPRARL